MNLGLLKLLAVPFFVAGFFSAIWLGECLATRSLHFVSNHPFLTIAMLVVEPLAVWGLVHLRKSASSEKPMTIDEIPSRLSGRTPGGLASNRLAFLLAVVANVLGLAAGVLFALTRYRG